MKNWNLLPKYADKFGEPVPLMYLGHLPDDEADQLVAAAIESGIPLDPEALAADVPKDALI